ncbi:hypothetical protein WA158_001754 [Blastocystis sp. Blastoise]
MSISLILDVILNNNMSDKNVDILNKMIETFDSLTKQVNQSNKISTQKSSNVGDDDKQLISINHLSKLPPISSVPLSMFSKNSRVNKHFVDVNTGSTEISESEKNTLVLPLPKESIIPSLHSSSVSNKSNDSSSVVTIPMDLVKDKENILSSSKECIVTEIVNNVIVNDDNNRKDTQVSSSVCPSISNPNMSTSQLLINNISNNNNNISNLNNNNISNNNISNNNNNNNNNNNISNNNNNNNNIDSTIILMPTESSNEIKSTIVVPPLQSAPESSTYIYTEESKEDMKPHISISSKEDDNSIMDQSTTANTCSLSSQNHDIENIKVPILIDTTENKTECIDTPKEMNCKNSEHEMNVLTSCNEKNTDLDDSNRIKENDSIIMKKENIEVQLEATNASDILDIEISKKVNEVSLNEELLDKHNDIFPTSSTMIIKTTSDNIDIESQIDSNNMSIESLPKISLDNNVNNNTIENTICTYECKTDIKDTNNNIDHNNNTNSTKILNHSNENIHDTYNHIHNNHIDISNNIPLSNTPSTNNSGIINNTNITSISSSSSSSLHPISSFFESIQKPLSDHNSSSVSIYDSNNFSSVSIYDSNNSSSVSIYDSNNSSLITNSSDSSPFINDTNNSSSISLYTKEKKTTSPPSMNKMENIIDNNDINQTMDGILLLISKNNDMYYSECIHKSISKAISASNDMSNSNSSMNNNKDNIIQSNKKIECIPIPNDMNTITATNNIHINNIPSVIDQVQQQLLSNNDTATDMKTPIYTELSNDSYKQEERKGIDNDKNKDSSKDEINIIQNNNEESSVYINSEDSREDKSISPDQRRSLNNSINQEEKEIERDRIENNQAHCEYVPKDKDIKEMLTENNKYKENNVNEECIVENIDMDNKKEIRVIEDDCNIKESFSVSNNSIDNNNNDNNNNIDNDNIDIIDDTSTTTNNNNNINIDNDNIDIIDNTSTTTTNNNNNNIDNNNNVQNIEMNINNNENQIINNTITNNISDFNSSSISPPNNSKDSTASISSIYVIPSSQEDLQGEYIDNDSKIDQENQSNNIIHDTIIDTSRENGNTTLNKNNIDETNETTEKDQVINKTIHISIDQSHSVSNDIPNSHPSSNHITDVSHDIVSPINETLNTIPIVVTPSKLSSPSSPKNTSSSPVCSSSSKIASSSPVFTPSISSLQSTNTLISSSLIPSPSLSIDINNNKLVNKNEQANISTLAAKEQDNIHLSLHDNNQTQIVSPSILDIPINSNSISTSISSTKTVTFSNPISLKNTIPVSANQIEISPSPVPPPLNYFVKEVSTKLKHVPVLTENKLKIDSDQKLNDILEKRSIYTYEGNKKKKEEEMAKKIQKEIYEVIETSNPHQEYMSNRGDDEDEYMHSDCSPSTHEIMPINKQYTKNNKENMNNTQYKQPRQYSVKRQYSHGDDEYFSKRKDEHWWRIENSVPKRDILPTTCSITQLESKSVSISGNTVPLVSNKNETLYGNINKLVFKYIPNRGAADKIRLLISYANRYTDKMIHQETLSVNEFRMLLKRNSIVQDPVPLLEIYTNDGSMIILLHDDPIFHFISNYIGLYIYKTIKQFTELENLNATCNFIQHEIWWLKRCQESTNSDLARSKLEKKFIDNILFKVLEGLSIQLEDHDFFIDNQLTNMDIHIFSILDQIVDISSFILSCFTNLEKFWTRFSHMKFITECERY